MVAFSPSTVGMFHLLVSTFCQAFTIAIKCFTIIKHHLLYYVYSATMLVLIYIYIAVISKPAFALA